MTAQNDANPADIDVVGTTIVTAAGTLVTVPGAPFTGGDTASFPIAAGTTNPGIGGGVYSTSTQAALTAACGSVGGLTHLTINKVGASGLLS